LEFEADRYFEIYLLSKENVCWYNNKDLLNFFVIDESKTKSLLKDRKKEITDIKMYQS
jgi:hypothetical protein